MKKLFCFLCVVILSFMLTSCNDQEKEQLQTVISYQVEAQEFYTPSSYEQYITALENAKAIMDKRFVPTKDLITDRNDLQSAIDNLYPRPDKSALQGKCENAKGIDKGLYIPASVLTLETAISKAKTVLNNDNAVIEEVTTAVTELDNVVNSLEKIPNKTELKTLLDKVKNINEEKYTTESYDAFTSTVTSASSIYESINSTQKQVDESAATIKSSIDNLVIARNAIYQITINTDMISNNHVGNEWQVQTTYNGQNIKNGDQITTNTNSSITIKATIVENDSIRDVGTGSVTLTSKDGSSSTIQINVRENRGRYSGNVAVWELTCSIRLIKRV